MMMEVLLWIVLRCCLCLFCVSVFAGVMFVVVGHGPWAMVLRSSLTLSCIGGRLKRGRYHN